MPYTQLFYHLVWATKERAPLITPRVRPMLYGFIRAKAVGLGGTVFAIGGVEDHVHVVTSVPPRIALATFIGQVKGVASAKVNREGILGDIRFSWQEEYGAFSFDRKRLPYVVAYVEQQEEHHAQGRTIRVLERVNDVEDAMLREDAPDYVPDYEAWLIEMNAL